MIKLNNLVNESKKNSIEQFDVQVTNNMNHKIQSKNYKLAGNINKFNDKKITPNNEILRKNEESKNFLQENEIKTLKDNKSNENFLKSNLRAINTSPLLIVFIF